jgi:hypothetical protein
MKQTATDWMFDQLWETPKDKLAWFKILMEAKEMEKEQIMRTAWHCHIEGTKQSSKTSQEYIQYAEQYYNETYETNA